MELREHHDARGSIFRLADNAPDALHGPAWLFMQSGSLGAVFLIALRPRSGAPSRVLLAGIAAWGGAKLVKPLLGGMAARAILANATS
jgi:hypothetical protein